MKILLPTKVKAILDRLEEYGYEGYAVGGCVRDTVMGRTPSDWDITTSATPQQIKRIFPHTVDTGITHGTITVMIEREGFEVTTYRIDGEYEDSRHPKQVIFTPSLRKDLRRRDFTVNAMAYNEKSGLVDCFGGIEDLKRGVIRCVGRAEERFGEDALRMMRAVRFCAQLGFELDSDTTAAMAQLAPTLKRISAERIQAELVKLLVSPHPDWLRMAWENGITAQVLPEFDRMMEQPQNNAHHIYSVGIHTLETMKAIPADRILRLTMLMHDMGKPDTSSVDEQGVYHYRGHAEKSAEIAAKILKRLKFDNDTYARTVRLVRNHSLYPAEDPESVRRSICVFGQDLFPAFLEVKRADILGQSPAVHQNKLAYLERIRRIYEGILERGECLSLKTMHLTGKDLIEDGMTPGRALGEILDQLFDEVLTDPQKNNREYLLERSRQLRKNSCGSRD